MPGTKGQAAADTRKRVLTAYRKGKKPAALAEEYGINVNTIKSWIRRANVPQKGKPGAVEPDAEGAPKRKRGAPKGNRNAVGNSGGPPLGSANALKHGGYSPVYWDTLTEEEKALIEGDAPDSEQLLRDEIDLLSIRERRIMSRIRAFTRTAEQAENGAGQVTAGVIRTEKLREFPGESGAQDRALYEQVQVEQIQAGELLPGHEYSLTTRTEAAYDVIHRLEEALTRCQAQKQRCIHSLISLQKASGEMNEMEDLTDAEALVYGSGRQSGTDD